MDWHLIETEAFGRGGVIRTENWQLAIMSLEWILFLLLRFQGEGLDWLAEEATLELD